MKTFYYIATTITSIIFMLFITAVVCHICSDHSSINKVDIILSVSRDSLSENSILKSNTKEIEKLITLINDQEKELNKQYELTMKARADEADLTKILSCVGAFVLAILAYFGINSHKELQEKLIQKAEETAKDETAKKMEIIATPVINNALNEKINDSDFASTLKRDIIDNIVSQHLVRLEEEMNNLKENFQLSSPRKDDSPSQPLKSDEEDIVFEAMGDVPDIDTLNK